MCKVMEFENWKMCIKMKKIFLKELLNKGMLLK